MQRSEELRGYISPTKDFSTNYSLENDGAKCNNRTQSTFLESKCLVTENRTRFLELDNDISYAPDVIVRPIPQWLFSLN